VSKGVAFDASALFALIQGEEEASVLQPLLKGAVMSAVNVAESLTGLQRLQIAMEEGLLLIADLVETICPFDAEQAKAVAQLYSQVKDKGLSLGDWAYIALGIERSIPIYTAYRIWGSLALPQAQIHFIR